MLCCSQATTIQMRGRKSESTRNHSGMRVDGETSAWKFMWTNRSFRRTCEERGIRTVKDCYDLGCEGEVCLGGAVRRNGDLDVLLAQLLMDGGEV